MALLLELSIKSLFKHINSIKYSELNTEWGQKYALFKRVEACQGVDVRLRTLYFIHEIWGASLKTPWPKPSLGKKD